MAENFGAYELGGRIALGGMAEVFRAKRVGDAGFSKSLVIKRVLPHFAEDEDFVRMFIDEAVLAAKLSHPNVVSVFDFGMHEGQYFLAMEYVEGLDLRRLSQFAKKKGIPLTPNHAVQIAIGMARGLGHAHERKDNGRPLGIVHRDVSPHNVLVSFDGEVKVFDFGIARAAARATRTSTGVVKGKLGYMAPEQARGEDLDARCDIYALGLVLWEMLAGRRAFTGDNEMQVLMRVQRGELPGIETVVECEPALAECVRRLCAPSLNDRYVSMRDAERDLAKILHALGGADAARLDELIHAVVDADLRLALQGDAEPTPGTMSLLPPVRDGSDSKQRTAAVVEESTAAESRSAVTWSEPLSPAESGDQTQATHTSTPLTAGAVAAPAAAPAKPTLIVAPEAVGAAVARANHILLVRRRRAWLGAVALAAVLPISLVWFFTARTLPDTTPATVGAPVPNLPLPHPEEPVIVPPPQPEAPAPAVTPTDIDKRDLDKKRDGPRRDEAKPQAAKATAFVTFFNCPRGATLFDNGQALKAAKNAPVLVGAHEFVMKDSAGKVYRFPRQQLKAGNNEMIDCGDAKPDQ